MKTKQNALARSGAETKPVALARLRAHTREVSVETKPVALARPRAHTGAYHYTICPVAVPWEGPAGTYAGEVKTFNEGLRETLQGVRLRLRQTGMIPKRAGVVEERLWPVPRYGRERVDIALTFTTDKPLFIELVNSIESLGLVVQRSKVA